MKKFFRLILILSLVASSVFGQGYAEKPLDSSSQIVYTDTYGYTTTIASAPKRVVSLAPNLTEAVFALEEGERLVGRTDYCTSPIEASEIPSVGDMYNVNIEKIVSLKPDLVICSSIISESTASTLRGLGVPLMIVNKEYSADGAFSIVTDLGYILGCPEKASEIVQKMKDKIDEVASIVGAAGKKSVYYCIGFGEFGDFTATGDTYINNIIRAAGGINAAEDGTNWAYSRERLVEKNPDIIVFPEYDYLSFESQVASFASTEPYSLLQATVDGKLYKIDANLLDRQGVMMAEAVQALAEIIHPELF